MGQFLRFVAGTALLVCLKRHLCAQDFGLLPHILSQETIITAWIRITKWQVSLPFSYSYHSCQSLEIWFVLGRRLSPQNIFHISFSLPSDYSHTNHLKAQAAKHLKNLQKQSRFSCWTHSDRMSFMIIYDYVLSSTLCTSRWVNPI